MRFHVVERPHVARLLLHPGDLGIGGLRQQRLFELTLRERVELLETDDGGAGVASLVTLGAQLVGDLPRAEQDPRRASDSAVRQHGKEAPGGELGDRRGGERRAQHPLRSQRHQRLAPGPLRLAAQQMEVLRGGRRLADLDVVLGG